MNVEDFMGSSLNTNKKTTLLWDMVENNIHPEMFDIITDLLIELGNLGFLIVLTTNNYALLKMFDVKKSKINNIMYHSLYFEDNSDKILCDHSKNYIKLEHNHIIKIYSYLYDKEVRNILGE